LVQPDGLIQNISDFIYISSSNNLCKNIMIVIIIIIIIVYSIEEYKIVTVYIYNNNISVQF
jgi:hypothetical protein